MSASIVLADDPVSIRHGQAYIEDVAVDELAAKFGTPLFVLSEATIRGNIRTFRDAMARHWPGPANVLPSVKGNFLLAVRRILNEEGAGCDTFGPGELWAACTVGTDPRLMSVNGTGKGRQLIADAIRYGARITIDNPDELDVIVAEAAAQQTVAEVRVRIRPDYGRIEMGSQFTGDGTSVGTIASRYKPGVSADVIDAFGKRLLAEPHVRLTGLMAHVGRHHASLDFWEQASRLFADEAVRLATAWGWHPSTVDAGGGFPTRRDPVGRARAGEADRALGHSIDEYVAVVAGTIADTFSTAGLEPSATTLEIEPGRSTYANAGIHLTQVTGVKAEARTRHAWIETDTTEMFLADALAYEESRLSVLNASKPEQQTGVVGDVVGMSCQFDIVVPDAELPPTEPGDLLLLLETGSYLEASASNFNALPRPGTVLVNGSDAEFIKLPETVAQVFARDVLPDRLVPR